MNRTPDEIKKGLECCTSRDCGGSKCPYFNEKSCNAAKSADALALIQQLEKDKDDLLEERELNDFLRGRVKQLEAERDAYREGLKTEVGCYGCKHYVDDPDYDSNECMSCGKNMCNFEWRGVQKD